jgi:catechol 2,3-dioxygenase-like lactoylglutathione lyase family enzyme
MTAFYGPVLATIGYARLRDQETTVGFGKRYPEFWLNARPALPPVADNGTHVCLRAESPGAVDAFHAAVLAHGGVSDGAPGMRPEYNDRYYAAFARDPEGNRIEVVTFLEAAKP